MLRKAKFEDISRIAEIIIFTKRMTYRPIFNNDHVSFNLMQVGPEIDRLRQDGELENIFVFDDGIVKAMIKVQNQGEITQISEFFVDPFFQGQGIGKKMLQTVLANHLNCQLDVLDRNVRAIGFYEHLGFQYTGEKEPFLDSGFYVLKYSYRSKEPQNGV